MLLDTRKSLCVFVLGTSTSINQVELSRAEILRVQPETCYVSASQTDGVGVSRFGRVLACRAFLIGSVSVAAK